MRRQRLIVSLLASAINQVARANQVVTFDDSDFSGTPATALFPQSQNDSRPFNFHSTQQVSIESISLYGVAAQSPLSGLLIAQGAPHSAVSGGNDGGNGGVDSITAVINKTPVVGPASATSVPSMVVAFKRYVPPSILQQSTPVGTSVQSTPVSLSINFDSPGTSGTVSIQNLYANGSYLNVPLYLVANWSIPGTNEVGSSSSRQFIFTDDFPTTCPEEDQLQASWCSLASVISAFPNPVFPDVTSTAASTAGLSAATPNASLISATGSAPAGASASAGNHLSTGAVVGIAVGCGFAGLLILCIVACVLIRRHKRRQNLREASPAPYGSRSRTEELMAEKEANAGVTETPHSPYSDDGMPGDSAGGAAAAIARRERSQPNGVINTNVERSYTPYSDNRSSVPALSPSATAVASSSQHNTEDQRHSVARSATPSGVVSGRYAHLVEEGMTEDDIRRLEEEERQLDAAIERSGRAH